ncbi:VP1 capsid protein [Norovirus dog/GVI.1/HKU_Ca026F/2007/HKG]|uniref:VP1 capsid protein n=1 Tax=Norovirus dog/GVI.1/HKU_Ca026F/2007/HKG TaxID=673457 RepID=J7EI81_NORV|nr:VP1 capsid protein [Norovirus dog/GVI.1/HKU_Ca026F/2007/HKG]ACV89840.1 VP1 capsid protein [Norovirus dog/GVI.1/HKU_Ca026F/2007/HKG]
MMMASSDATPPSEGATNLVPEVNTQVVPLEPVAGAAAAAPFTGQNNVIDPWIFQNFVQAPQGEFTVSPRNTPGEILLRIPLGPNLNPFLAHLSRMYNAWVGGMEAEMILAGNAFTAGKLLIVALPPGFEATQLTPAQATAFPHVIADVRTLEPIPIPLPDIRNVLFHYNGDPTPTIQIVVMLYTPLRTNGNGDDVFTVSGRLLTRPAPDFSFSFLVPPTVEQKTRSFTLPNLAVSDLSNSRFPAPVNILRADPNTTLALDYQNGRCTLDGALQGTTPTNSSFLGYLRGTVDRVNSDQVHVHLREPNGDPFQLGLPGPQGVPDYRATLDIYVDWENKNHGNPCEGTLNTGSQTEYTPGLGTLTFNKTSGDTPEQGDPVIMRLVAFRSNLTDQLPAYNGAFGQGENLAPPVSPPVPGEVFLQFGSRYTRLGERELAVQCLLPSEWITHFYSEAAPIQGEAMLLRYVQPDLGRILFEAKLYKEGFVTVAGGTNPVTFPIDGTFVAVSWVSRNFVLSPMGSGQGRRRAALAE